MANIKFKIFIFSVLVIYLPACAVLGLQKNALIKAAADGDLAKAEAVLAKGVDVNNVTEDQRFALMAAASSGNPEIVELLVENGADVNLANESGMTALMGAGANGHEAVAEFLINQGADLSLKDKRGRSALHYAAENGDTDLIGLLIDHGAEVSAIAEDGSPPLFVAIENENESAAALLIESGAKLDATENESKEVAEIFNADGELNATNAEGSTALHLAAKKANYELVKLLIDAGVDIPVKNKNGDNSLLILCGSDHYAIIDNLYRRVANEKVEAPEEKFSLNELSSSLESIEPEYSSDEDINQFYDNLEQSRLYIDIAEAQFQSMIDQLHKDYLLTAKLLLNSGVAVNTTDRRQKTAIMKICGQKGDVSEEFKKKSIKLAPDVEKRFEMACEMAKNIHYNMIRLLMNFGADITLRDENGQTALMTACENGHLEYAKLLLKNGAEVNKVNEEGWTPLLYAAVNEDLETAKLLIEAGANVNAANSFGETALLKAVHRNNVKMVSLLLENGADPDIKNFHHSSPRSIAKEYGYSEILEMLK